MKNENEIITMTGSNGKKIDFYLDAEIEYLDEQYVVVHPVNDDLGLSCDEALVFLVESDNEGDHFSLVEDDSILDEIGKIFNQN